MLECHPTDPALAVSGSYDGRLVLWDLRAGAALRTFDSRDTRPDGRSWPDHLPLTDGQFSPDGRAFAATDVAGQVHIYAQGAPCPLAARAPYDQFLSTDFNRLMRDAHHHVIDADTQVGRQYHTSGEGR